MEREDATIRQLVSRWMNIERKLEGEITSLAYEIDEARRNGQKITDAKLYRMERYQSLLAQAKSEVEQFSKINAAEVMTLQRTYAMDGKNFMDEALSPLVQVGVNFNRLPADAVNAAIAYTSDGAPLAKLLMKDYPSTAAGIMQALLDGIAQGWNPRKIASAMKEALSGNLQRALVIARTETLRAFRDAAQTGMEGNADVLEGWIWSSALTSATCPVCWGLHGSFHPLTEKLNDHICGRCVPVPVTKPLAQIDPRLKGLTDPRVRVPMGDMVLRGKSDEFARSILGPGRYDLWKSGVDLSDMVRWTDDPEWGMTPALKALKDLAHAH